MQRAGDLAIAGVVIENCGDTLLDGVHVQRGGAGTGTVHHQVAVNGPPCTIQHLIEVGGVIAHDAQAAGQRRVNVGMGVDQRRHDDAAPGVNDLGGGIFGTQRGLLAHLHDIGALIGHRAVLVIPLAIRIAGDEPSVGYQCHNRIPSCKKVPMAYHRRQMQKMFQTPICGV